MERKEVYRFSLYASEGGIPTDVHPIYNGFNYEKMVGIPAKVPFEYRDYLTSYDYKDTWDLIIAMLKNRENIEVYVYDPMNGVIPFILTDFLRDVMNEAPKNARLKLLIKHKWGYHQKNIRGH